MKKSDIEKMLATSNELTPSTTLKKRVCDASLNVEPFEEPSRVKMSLVKRLSLVMTPLMLIIGVFFTGFGLANEKYQSIYIDINPSVEIVLNRFDYIVEVNYLNDDAVTEYSELSLKGKKVETGIDEILNNLEAKGYLEKAEMLISVVSKTDKSAEELLEKTETKANNFMQDKGKDVKVDGNKHSKDEKEAAEEHQLSPAKFKLIEYIMNLDTTYVVEDLKVMTVEELSELLNSLSGEVIQDILDKPFDPKHEKPFGDVDFDELRPNKPEGPKDEHVCTEECPEDCEEALKPEHPGEKHVCTEECPEDCEEALKPEHKGDKHVCTEECPEDCELALKPECPKGEKHVCTEECPEDCKLALQPECPKGEKHVCTEECPEDCELALQPECPKGDKEIDSNNQESTTETEEEKVDNAE